MSTGLDDARFTATRRALHAVCERLIAGPQFRTTGTIRVVPSPGGFRGAAVDVAVVGTDLLVGSTPFTLDGTIATVGSAAVLTPERPSVYAYGAELGDNDPLIVDGQVATVIAAWFDTGSRGLASFAPDADATLWPEHFDLAISVGSVNFGVSPGDSLIARPYAYVGPWARRTGSFWTEPFGAVRSIDEVGDVDALADFFRRGRARADADPLAPGE